MTYGYAPGGSSSSHKYALNSDSGSSERYRIEEAKKERERQERERAKALLVDVQRKLDHAKLELSQHQTEARRLETEIEHEGRGVQAIESMLALSVQKEHAIKAHSSDSEQVIQKLEKELFEKRKNLEENKTELLKLENQLREMEQDLHTHRRLILDLESEIQKNGVQARQVALEKHKHDIEAEHARSDRMYKEKEVDNKKRALGFLQQKREHALREQQRLHIDILKMEMEIKTIEPKTK